MFAPQLPLPPAQLHTAACGSHGGVIALRGGERALALRAEPMLRGLTASLRRVSPRCSLRLLAVESSGAAPAARVASQEPLPSPPSSSSPTPPPLSPPLSQPPLPPSPPSKASSPPQPSSALKPTEPGPEDCCNSGCESCVWTIYLSELEVWESGQRSDKPP